MPGGDFLGLLRREHRLHEATARFYIAEMILAVEETHRLNFIHRDIKPENFLLTSSGHIKISDFGLAFDGHWTHDWSYFNWHRYSLVRKLGIHVDGDTQDQRDSRTAKGQLHKIKSLSAGSERHESKPVGTDEDLTQVISWRNRHGIRGTANSVVGTSAYMAPEVLENRGYDGRCD